MSRPLEGIRVVEAAGMVAGPYCGKLLADLGAEVVKVEPPGGDPARRRGPFLEEAAEPHNSALFLYLNAGKLGVTLDLRRPESRPLFRRLIEEADVLIEDVPPGEKAALGLDPEEIRKLAPRLIHISVTPFGSSGPYRDFKTHHINRYMAGGDGYMIFVRREYLDRPPLQGPGYLADYEAGVGAAIAVLGALLYRDLSGEGQFIDQSEQEWCLALNAIYLGKYPNEDFLMDRARMEYALGGIMECRDGYVMLMLLEDHHWWRLVKLMGDPPWAFEERLNTHYKRTQHREEVNARVQEWFRRHSKEELYHMAQAQGIPLAPIYTPAEVLASPQLQSRGFFISQDHPRAGRLTLPSAPYRFSRCEYMPPGPAPQPGEHNHEVYRRLGYTDEALAELRRSGVI